MKKLCTLFILILIFKLSNAMEVKKPGQFNLDKWLEGHQLWHETKHFTELTEQQAQILTNDMQSKLSNKSQNKKDSAVEKICEFIYGDDNFKYRKALITGAVLAGAHTSRNRNNECYNQPLKDAVMFNDLEFARFLLENHANPNALINILFGPVIFFAKSVEMAQLLIERGVKPASVRVWVCQNLLHRVISGRYTTELLSLYLQHGTDPNFKAEWGDTPLHELTNSIERLEHKVNLEAAEILLKHGANANIKNNEKHTPAQYAFARAKYWDQKKENETDINWLNHISEKQKQLIMLGRFILSFQCKRMMKDPTTYSSLLPKKARDLIFEYFSDSAYRATPTPNAREAQLLMRL